MTSNYNNMNAPGGDRNVTTGYNDLEGTHGPHQSRVGNAMDPRVDSDRDNVRPTGVPGSDRNVVTGYNDPEGTHGPHQSRVGNTLDPRVDSDRDNVRAAGVPGSDRNVVTGYNDPEGTHGPHQSRAANAMDPRVDSDRDNVAATGAAGAATERPVGNTTSTGTQTMATGGENMPAENQRGKGGGLFENVKGRVAQAHGIGESARGQFNAAMGGLLHDKKGQAKGEATAAGGKREFANKEFERHGTLDKAL